MNNQRLRGSELKQETGFILVAQDQKLPTRSLLAHSNGQINNVSGQAQMKYRQSNIWLFYSTHTRGSLRSVLAHILDCNIRGKRDRNYVNFLNHTRGKAMTPIYPNFFRLNSNLFAHSYMLSSILLYLLSESLGPCGSHARLQHRSKRVRTPIAHLCSLSDKYCWEMYELPYSSSYSINSTRPFFLWWLWY